VFSDFTVMEIIDEETLKPINEIEKPGKLYLTNLTRSLMPIIRYPVGDRAMWLESPTDYRKFKILGRSEEGARIGPATVYYEDISALLSHSHSGFNVKGFQLVTKHFQNKDQLVIKVATTSRDTAEMEHLKSRIEAERSFLKELSHEKQIHPLKIEFVDITDLETNPRTGKLKRLIDERKT
jgi:phenylacetate-CoA ligase